MRRAVAIMNDEVDATARNDLSCLIAHGPHTKNADFNRFAV
jgi:hypothetical protein